MKTKVIGYSSEAVSLGIGIMITKLADTWVWVGFVLIGAGIAGIVVTSLWGKLKYSIPTIKFERRTKAGKHFPQITWLNNLINEQIRTPQNYLHPQLHRVFLSSKNELGFEIKWFNCSNFDYKFTSLTGEVHINKTSIGHQLKLRGKFDCPIAGNCFATFDVMVDSSVINLIQQAISVAGRVECGFLLNWDVSPGEISKSFFKPFVKQWSEQNILTIPKS